MRETICLIGFMGSGKTTVGAESALLLGYDWVDLDQHIEKNEKTSIAALFASKGEAYFRQLETLYLQKAVEKPCVISTGGGIVVTPQNVEVLKKQRTFYLNYEFDTLYERIANDATRPLATSYEEVRLRYDARQALYKAASQIQIQCDHKSVEAIVEEIIKAL